MATATKPNPFKCNYNPNIMRWLGTEYDFADTEIKTYGETRKQLKNGVWGYRDTYRNNIEFMRIMKSFKSQVADLDALIAKHKVKNKIIQKCGVIPYTPVFGYNLGKPYRDNGCCQTKMGGIPDLRNELAMAMHYGNDKEKNKTRSYEDALLSLWPVGPSGNPMRFMAQWHISAAEACFLQCHNMDFYDGYSIQNKRSYHDMTRSHDKNSCHSMYWGYTFYIFVDSYAPYFDSRLDSAIRSSYDHKLGDYAKPYLLSWRDYSALVQKVIVRNLGSHLEDDASLWSLETTPLIKQGMFIDLDCREHNLPDDQYRAVFNKWDSKYDDFEDDLPYYSCDVNFLGVPRSQQTVKRYFDTRGWRMRPFMNYSDPNHDYTWQIYSGFQGLETITYGKVDGSCT